MRIYIKTIPKSSQNKLEKISEGEFKAWVTETPEKGQANEAVVKLVAEHFDVSKSCVNIISGKSARKKLVEITV